MTNTKLTKFIITNQDFYNSLNESHKELISDLDFYISNIYENSFIIECYNSDCNRDPLVTTDFIYFYIGNKNNQKYYLKVIYSYYNNAFIFNISSAQLIIKKKILLILEVINLYMNNIKFTEFIIKNQNFYNSLIDKEKELISDLDEYNLSLYKINRELDPYEVILYIGRKNNKNFFYKCKFAYNKCFRGYIYYE